MNTGLVAFARACEVMVPGQERQAERTSVRLYPTLNPPLGAQQISRASLRAELAILLASSSGDVAQRFCLGEKQAIKLKAPSLFLKEWILLAVECEEVQN